MAICDKLGSHVSQTELFIPQTNTNCRINENTIQHNSGTITYIPYLLQIFAQDLLASSDNLAALVVDVSLCKFRWYLVTLCRRFDESPQPI